MALRTNAFVRVLYVQYIYIFFFRRHQNNPQFCSLPLQGAFPAICARNITLRVIQTALPVDVAPALLHTRGTEVLLRENKLPETELPWCRQALRESRAFGEHSAFVDAGSA